MITVSMGMVFRSAVYSLVSGAVFGILYAFSRRIICEILNLIRRLFHLEKKEFFQSGFAKNALDFILVIALGISQLLSNYVLLDGVFRAYTAILTIVTFVWIKGIFYCCGSSKTHKNGKNVI